MAKLELGKAKKDDEKQLEFPETNLETQVVASAENAGGESEAPPEVPQEVTFARPFFWRGTLYPKGRQKCPKRLTKEKLPVGAVWH